MRAVASTERALELTRECGFDLAGVAPLHSPRDAEHWRRWIERGRHAGMDWLERDLERVADPRTWAPRGRSLLVVGLGHSRPAVQLPDGASIARYAAGRDYHNVMRRRLRKLRRLLQQEGLIGKPSWSYVSSDSVPLLERSHAAEAGLGFSSKAANLLHPSFGPWFFLGEVIVDVELEPTPAPPAGSCGTCRACLDACPTGAIVAPGEVDARLCLSYHNIESEHAVPRELRAGLGQWAFGCDVCSQVCPWGAKAPDLSERFGLHPSLAEHGVVRWLELADEAEVSSVFAGAALQRPRRAGLARNAAIVLGNREGHEADQVLLRALNFDPEPLVREAAGWALARTRSHSAAVRAALEAAYARESDPAARAELRRSLDGEL